MTLTPDDGSQPRRERSYSREQEIRVLEVVDRIVTCGVLGAGERMPAMLRYLVREELAGRGDRIKSFSIATEVLGRGQSFDPQSDSIARAEMTRLRKAVDHYNATVGASEPVQVTIPKGSYRPFIIAGETIEPSVVQPAVKRGRFWPLAVALVVISIGIAASVFAVFRSPYFASSTPRSLPPLLVMQPVTTATSLAGMVEGFQAELASELARQPWLSVIQPNNLMDIEQQLSRAAARRAIYVLETRLTALDQGYRVTAYLKHWPDQAIRWSTVHDNVSLAGHSLLIERGFVVHLTQDIAALGGGLMLAELARLESDGKYETRFICLMTVRRYWRGYDPGLRKEAERCLADSVLRDPDFASGRAALALFKIEKARQAASDERSRLLSEAQAQLTGIANSGLLSRQAAMALAACQSDHGRGREVAEALAKAYPSNPDVLADVGSKLGLVLGDWPKAAEMEARAMTLNPTPDPWYPLATIAKAMLDGQPQRAVNLLSQAPQRQFRTGQIIRLAVGGAADDRALIADAQARLRDMGIATLPAARAAIEGECWSREVKQVFQRGVEAALR